MAEGQLKGLLLYLALRRLKYRYATHRTILYSWLEGNWSGKSKKEKGACQRTEQSGLFFGLLGSVLSGCLCCPGSALSFPGQCTQEGVLHVHKSPSLIWLLCLLKLLAVFGSPDGSVGVMHNVGALQRAIPTIVTRSMVYRLWTLKLPQQGKSCGTKASGLQIC